jgi:hypothetical protein
MTTNAPSSDSTLDRLKAANIAPVFIIDDAFDPPRSGDDVDQFWFEARKDDAVRGLVEAVQPVSEAADIGPDAIRAIWGLRDGAPKLKELADRHLFATRLEQLEDLKHIVEHLRAAGLDPQPRGIAAEIPATARLVFLDYVLDPTRTLELAKVAADRAVKLYDAAPADAKPFIVLMSDHPDAVEQHTLFREESKLMGGLFAFIKKAEARERERLFFRLGTWRIANANFSRLQEFVVSVLQGLEESVKTFKARVFSLEVHDYSFIQKECLYKDGQPLGDYLMWLFEASLGHSMRNHADVVARQGTLDSMRFDKLFPSDRTPTDNLAKFYESAVTEPAVEELKPHPLDPTGAVPCCILGMCFFVSRRRMCCWL